MEPNRRQALIKWLKAGRDAFKASREKYTEQINEYKNLYEKSSTEGWTIYDSGLEAREPTGDDDEGYFSPGAEWSFDGLDGFNQNELAKFIIEFLEKPENSGREIIILDSFGQGRPGQELREMVLKKIPTARITVIATTLTPGRDNKGDVIEFNNDMLSEEYSGPVFKDITARNMSGGALLVTFFRPAGGMADADTNSYIQFTLYEHLRALFSLTAEHGLLFLQSPSDRGEMKFLRELLARYNAEDLLVTRGDSVGLLRKEPFDIPQTTLPRRNGQLVLPSPHELMLNHWDLVQKYWNVPD